MTTIESITREINKELVPLMEERLRAYLITQDKDWLIEQIIRLSLDAHSLQEKDRKFFQKKKAKQRAERIARLQVLALDRSELLHFLDVYKDYDRARLIKEKYLLKTAPPKGAALIDAQFRTDKGNLLLTQAKDILFGLLFGDTTTNTHFKRIQREMLTLTMPQSKADALDFMKAATEQTALGTWQDPDNVSNDANAINVILDVEYGEIEGELIGKGIVRTLSLINSLEVNEQILYARMINIEQSTLIE